MEEMRCFVKEQFWKGMVTVNYSGTLIYANLYGDKDGERKYGEGVISVSEIDFSTYAVHICDELKESAGTVHLACTVPARFTPFRYIDDLRNFEGNRTSQMVQEVNLRFVNVEFVQIIVPNILSILKRTDIMGVRKLLNTERGAELFEDYEYSYQSVSVGRDGATQVVKKSS